MVIIASPVLASYIPPSPWDFLQGRLWRNEGRRLADDFANRDRPEDCRAMIQGVLPDLSGVSYVGEDRLPGARQAFRRLAAEGIPVAAVTNTTRTPTSLFTAPMAARAYLDAHQLSPFLLVHPPLRREFADLAQRPPGAVLVGDAGQGFAYRRLNEVFRLLMEGTPLLAVGTTRYFRDVIAAIRAGLQGILTRTGKYQPGDEVRVRAAGGRVVQDIAGAVTWLLDRRG